MTPDNWTPGRLNDRFASIDEHFHDLREQIRVFAPMVRTTAELEVKLDTLEEDVRELKGDVKDIVNRSVTLRIVIVVTPVFLTCLGIGVALLSGGLR